MLVIDLPLSVVYGYVEMCAVGNYDYSISLIALLSLFARAASFISPMFLHLTLSADQ